MSDNDDAVTGGCRVVLPSAQPMYQAAERWRDESLINDSSLFSGERVDGTVAAQELVEAFVLQPNVAPGTFYERLEEQLAGVSPTAVQLVAELLFIYYLIASPKAARAETKREQIQAVLAFRKAGTSAFPDDLFPALAGGVANPGRAYSSYRWKMLAYLVRFVEAVKTLSTSQRAATLTDWDSFQQLLDGLDDQSVWTQRYALEHLLFPDRAPKVVSRDDRQAISKAFAEHLGEELPVEEIARNLRPNTHYGNQACVDFYRSPYREHWQAPSQKMAVYLYWFRRFIHYVSDELMDEWRPRAQHAAAAIDAAGEDEDIYSPLSEALGSHSADGSAFVEWVQTDDAAARHALVAFTEFQGAEAIDRFIERLPEDALPSEDAQVAVASVFVMSQGIEEYPFWPRETASMTHRLTDGHPPHQAATAGEKYVLYLDRLDAISSGLGGGFEVLTDRLLVAALADLLVRASWKEDWFASDWREFEAWRAGKAVALTSRASASALSTSVAAPIVDAAADASSPASLEDLAASLSMDGNGEEWLNETIELLKHKRQLILQGPPGTGKTYISRSLAEFLAGDPGRVTVTQFHPGTTYEDFVQGLRPDPENSTSFTVIDGPLLRVAREAGEHPQDTYVLLIDEINRGNVPAVFGELYYLLEYRSHEVTLTYGQKFSLPENLFFIGTMNTADRSITTLDAALRRRFYIRDLRPGETPMDGILRKHLQAGDAELGWLADLLARANSIIKDKDQYVGPSHFMGEGMDETWARRAWENTVMPTLREIFYNRPDILVDLEFETLKAAVTQTAGDAAAD